MKVLLILKIAVLTAGLLGGLSGPLYSAALNPERSSESEAADPVAGLLLEHQEQRRQEKRDVDRLMAQLAELDRRAGRPGLSLDGLLEITTRREKIHAQLDRLEKEHQKNETRRRRELERLQREIQKSDIKKFEQIVQSPYGKGLRKSARQALIAKYPEAADGKGPWKFLEAYAGDELESITNTVGMRFVRIPAGKFSMGSPEQEPGRDPDEALHTVTIDREFYLQTTEVTQAQWRQVMGSDPSFFSECGDTCPVEGVSYRMCQEFIHKLNRLEQTHKYRLPTEAEWEYASRSGSPRALANGPLETTQCAMDENLDQIGWYCGNSERSVHPVAQKKPNSWGLYDMHGNVWEWCRDFYGDYPDQPAVAPTGPSRGRLRIVRGGSWLHYAVHSRSANRMGQPERFRSRHLGLRLVREP